MPRGCKSVAQSGGRRMNARFNPEEFVKERNEALFSLDEDIEKAIWYLNKYLELRSDWNDGERISESGKGT